MLANCAVITSQTRCSKDKHNTEDVICTSFICITSLRHVNKDTQVRRDGGQLQIGGTKKSLGYIFKSPVIVHMTKWLFKETEYIQLTSTRSIEKVLVDYIQVYIHQISFDCSAKQDYLSILTHAHGFLSVFPYTYKAAEASKHPLVLYKLSYKRRR